MDYSLNSLGRIVVGIVLSEGISAEVATERVIVSYALRNAIARDLRWFMRVREFSGREF